MQRKRGSNHADWHFFTCITKNRLGAGKCTGMYVREEDIYNAIYRQLKVHVNGHYITNLQYKQQIQQFNDQIFDLTQRSEKAWENAREYYEQYVQGETDKEALRAALDVAHDVKAVLAETSEQKATYDKEYSIFRKLLSASDKSTPLSEIVDCIDTTDVSNIMDTVNTWLNSFREKHDDFYIQAIYVDASKKQGASKVALKAIE